MGDSPYENTIKKGDHPAGKGVIICPNECSDDDDDDDDDDHDDDDGDDDDDDDDDDYDDYDVLNDLKLLIQKNIKISYEGL